MAPVMQKILVTGSNGMVASYIPLVFSTKNLLLMDKSHMDITHPQQVARIIQKNKPNIIIHLAAATNVDACEKEQTYAMKVNYLGTSAVAKAAKNVGATILYLSSSAVFDGQKKYYLEHDIPNPINVYGKSKLLGEQVIQQMHPRFIILRCGWIIGGGAKEKKFLSFIKKQLDEGKKEIFASNDQYGCIMYGKHLVAFMKELVDEKRYGIYHVGSRNTCSRFDLAKYFVRKMGGKTKITPTKAAIFQSTFFAPRPQYEVVRSTKKQYHQSWQQSVDAYITNEF